MKVSVILPVDRPGTEAERAIDSVLAQQAPFPFELIVVSSQPVAQTEGNRLLNVIDADRNPAARRNRAAARASGEYLAFIDDDATADPLWLATAINFLDAHPDVLALGGPDPAPLDSSNAELISETLLATPLIGSGVLCHEGPDGIRHAGSASDVALVNLFVRHSAFTQFDESIGYIGEDTALLHRLMPHVVYHSGVRVHHRRRAFPGPYLRQRWRYRLRTGEMLARRARAYSANRKIWMFLLAGSVGISLAPILALPYFIATLLLGISRTRLPRSYWPMLPFAFAAHHLTYFAGIIAGYIRGLRAASRRG